MAIIALKTRNRKPGWEPGLQALHAPQEDHTHALRNDVLHHYAQ
jgi:hypothetical protein